LNFFFLKHLKFDDGAVAYDLLKKTSKFKGCFSNYKIGCDPLGENKTKKNGVQVGYIMSISQL